ncbi:Fc.00g065620.m01.CDS01 [Cosmosporella sp. VM-42]
MDADAEHDYPIVPLLEADSIEDCIVVDNTLENKPVVENTGEDDVSKDDSVEDCIMLDPALKDAALDDVSADDELDYDAYPADSAHTHTFILLHDHNSNDALLCQMLKEALSPMVVEDIFPGVKIVLPVGRYDDTADLRTWFLMDDKLREYDCNACEQEWAEMADTGYMVDQIVEREALLVGRENVFVAGLGRGCTIGLSMLLQTEDAIGGFFGIGGFMPYFDDVKSMAFDGFVRYNEEKGRRGEDQRKLHHAESNVEPGQSMDVDAGPIASSQEGDAETPAAQPAKPSGQSSQDRLKRVVDFFRSFTWEDVTAAPKTNAVGTPVVLLHAPDDPMVPLSHSKDALKLLRYLGFEAKLVRPGKGEHTVSKDVLEALLVEVLNGKIGDWELRKGVVESFQNNARY